MKADSSCLTSSLTNLHWYSYEGPPFAGWSDGWSPPQGLKIIRRRRKKEENRFFPTKYFTSHDINWIFFSFERKIIFVKKIDCFPHFYSFQHLDAYY